MVGDRVGLGEWSVKVGERGVGFACARGEERPVTGGGMNTRDGALIASRIVARIAS
jgi:hypothetical protein